MSWEICEGDCVALMAEMPEASVDAVVTDPPYGIRFMGKAWDGADIERMAATQASKRPRSDGRAGDLSPAAAAGTYDMSPSALGAFQAWCRTWAAEVLRVLKPGGHLVAFGGTRTHHRLWCAVEDAGFEIRDTLCWLYGSGFPKSLDVSKAIDKAAGAEREDLGESSSHHGGGTNHVYAQDEWTKENFAKRARLSAPATDAARAWAGWGTALKPAWESIVLARKPFDAGWYCAILARKIQEALCRFPSAVKDAVWIFSSSRSACVGDVDSALWRAVAGCNTSDALYALMATWPSELALPSALSIAWSWLDTLAALSDQASRFTTETAISLTTDLRTLNSLLSPLTPATIIEAAISPRGTASNASLAADLFSAVRLRLAITLDTSVLAPATETGDAAALRPDFIPIILARKPLSEPTVVANVQGWGTGALNVDGCRVAGSWERSSTTRSDIRGGAFVGGASGRLDCEPQQSNLLGRWPANVVLSHAADCERVGTKRVKSDSHTTHKREIGDGNIFGGGGRLDQDLGNVHAGPDGLETVEDWRCTPDCPVAMLDAQSGERESTRIDNQKDNVGKIDGAGMFGLGLASKTFFDYRDTGGASRFFYCTKADRAEREIGVDRNRHPTVKPIALMQWLCRLVTPPGGLILDPFAGSGSTGIAALREGFQFLGMEREPDYVAIARARIIGDAPLLNSPGEPP